MVIAYIIYTDSYYGVGKRSPRTITAATASISIGVFEKKNFVALIEITTTIVAINVDTRSNGINLASQNYICIKYWH